jgi:hypothetical protein
MTSVDVVQVEVKTRESREYGARRVLESTHLVVDGAGPICSLGARASARVVETEKFDVTCGECRSKLRRLIREEV